MRYAKIRKSDIANGPGQRVTLFVQGCGHHCKGCFNGETWNYNGGYEWTDEKREVFLSLAEREGVSGITLLGGDPFYQTAENLKEILTIVKEYKKRNPNGSVWVWTGFTYEEIYKSYIGMKFTKLSKEQAEVIYEIYKYIDVMVEGRFDITLNRPNIKWRGSYNQRFVDVQKSELNRPCIINDIEHRFFE